jgi:drug/metabolite transporter (DMT)-like permease
MSKFALVAVFTVSTLFTVFSQVALKYGLKQIGVESFKLSIIPSLALQMFVNLYVWAWFIFALLAMFLWIWGLAFVDLSWAYPFLSIGYIVVVIVSAVFLQEHISLLRWTGVALISIGMLLIYKT